MPSSRVFAVCAGALAIACGGSTPHADSSGAGAAGATPGAGGSSASAGANQSGGNPGLGGNPDVPPHPTVSSCDKLGAVGAWENITPPGVHLESDHGYGTSAIAVDPINQGTVYVGTSTNVQLPSFNSQKGDGIWKTTDCGATWVHINTGTNGDKLDNARQWTFNIDPTDSKVLYTNAGYGTGGLFKSVDGGVNWADITPTLDMNPGFVGNTQMDPSHHEHILLTWHADCGGKDTGCLSETVDGGKTWRNLFGNPPWVSQVRVYVLQSKLWLVPSNGLWLTKDGGDTWTKVASDSDAGGHSAGGLYATKGGVFYIGTEYGVISSTDGSTWTSIPNSGQWVGGIIGNGTTMFQSGTSGILYSREDDGKTWTKLESPLTTQGFIDYDKGHNVLYASCANQGLWRVRTE